MSNSFGYIDIILLGMIAGFIILRLRSILGRKTGHESKVYPTFAEKEFNIPKNEVKPAKQTEPPKKKSRVTKSYLFECKTYAVNQAKWKAAQEYCADRRIEFKIITERELGIK